MSDDSAIRSAVVALAIEGDTGTLEQYAALLAPDVQVASPGGEADGKDTVLAASAQRRTDGTVGPGSGARHHVTPGVVSVAGDRARVRSYFSFYVRVDGRPQLAAIGDYDDEFVRSGDQWLLRRRRVTFG